jgi:hypothetical protein
MYPHAPVITTRFFVIVCSSAVAQRIRAGSAPDVRDCREDGNRITDGQSWPDFALSVGDWNQYREFASRCLRRQICTRHMQLANALCRCVGMAKRVQPGLVE